MKFELIWQGRLQVGDEPGVYGDAHYAGLCSEWPVTVRRFDPTSNNAGEAVFKLDADDVKIYSPSPGHRTTIWRWLPDPTPTNPYQWKKVQITAAHLTANHLEIDVTVPGDAATIYLSVRLEVDDTVHPGLFDEFVVTRLSFKSLTHYASFGFIYENDPTHDV